MNRFDGGAPKTQDGIMSFAENFLTGDDAAVRIRDALAGEIDENLEAHLVGLFELRGGDDRELGLALLHGHHAQVGGADYPEINITFWLDPNISKPQAHRENRRRGGRMIRTDLASEL